MMPAGKPVSCSDRENLLWLPRSGKRFFGNFNLTIQDEAAVTIGDNCVIGAGSVVTKDPADCIAVGNPAKVLRRIADADSLRYHPEILGEYTLP